MVDISKRRLFRTKQVDESEIRLPWVKDLASFTDLCTRCGKCVQACETSIIVHGDGGFPNVDFSLGECTFCYKCASSCPEPIFADEQEEVWQAKAQIGESCIAKQNVECRSCGDMCDPMAIRFKLEIGRVAQPNIELDECNGCGACVSVCPTSSINVSKL